MPDEISIEKVMTILELPMETMFKLSQAKTPEAQATELAEVKAIVMMQRQRLLRKYTMNPGLPVETPFINRQVTLINQAADIIHSLELAPVPGGRLVI